MLTKHVRDTCYCEQLAYHSARAATMIMQHHDVQHLYNITQQMLPGSDRCTIDARAVHYVARRACMLINIVMLLQLKIVVS